jgi:hypothetical protein
MNRALVAVVFASFGVVPQALRAQGAASSGPAASYPNVDRPMALGPGDTVQVLNRIIVDRAPGQRGSRMDVHYSTHIPASDATARAEQADRVAQVVGADAWKIGARRVTLSICETRACAETREPPRQWYVYERVVGGEWRRSKP